MIQTGTLNWLAENLVLTVAIITILNILILAIYIKLFVRIFQEGTTYRHYRKGRLLRESDRGGMVVLIPFIDKIEIDPPAETSIEDIADSNDDIE